MTCVVRRLGAGNPGGRPTDSVNGGDGMWVQIPAGDPWTVYSGWQFGNVSRFDLRIPDVARVHGTMVMIFLGAVLVMVWLLRRDRAPHAVQQRVTVLLVVLVAQAGVGYAQYFNDIPALLVGIHIAGATAVWSATVALYLGLFERTATVPVATRAEPLLAPA